MRTALLTICLVAVVFSSRADQQTAGQVAAPEHIRVGMLRPGGGYSVTAIPLETYIARAGDRQVRFDSREAAFRSMLQRGQERFNIYCSVCHGYNAEGGNPAEFSGGQAGRRRQGDIFDDGERRRVGDRRGVGPHVRPEFRRVINCAGGGRRDRPPGRIDH